MKYLIISIAAMVLFAIAVGGMMIRSDLILIEFYALCLAMCLNTFTFLYSFRRFLEMIICEHQNRK